LTANAARAGSFSGDDLLSVFAMHDQEIEREEEEEGLHLGVLAGESYAAGRAKEEKDLGLMDEGVQRALSRFEDYLFNALTIPYQQPTAGSLPSKMNPIKSALNLARDGQPLTFANDLCYIPSPSAAASTCFHLTSLTSRTLIITLTFPASPSHLPSASTLVNPSANSLPLSYYPATFASKLQNLPMFSIEGTTVKPEPLDTLPGSGGTAWGAEAVIAGKRIGEMKSMRWMLYAFVALVVRFWSLAKVSSVY
jgi:hypothetical protein